MLFVWILPILEHGRLIQHSNRTGIHIPALNPSGNEGSHLGWLRKASIWQSECVHRVSTCTYNVLFPIYSVSDRATRIGTAQVYVPQRLAGRRIECHKVAVHPTSEH
jgi:hypothetical protein